MQKALEDNIEYVFHPFLADVDSRMTSPFSRNGQKFHLFSCYYSKFLLFNPFNPNYQKNPSQLFHSYMTWRPFPKHPAKMSGSRSFLQQNPYWVIGFLHLFLLLNRKSRFCCQDLFFTSEQRRHIDKICIPANAVLFSEIRLKFDGLPVSDFQSRVNLDRVVHRIDYTLLCRQ